MKYVPKMTMAVLGPMLESIHEPNIVFRKMKLLELQEPELLDKMLASLLTDSALAQMLDPIRAAVRALAAQHGFRVCPDCGMPTIREEEEYFGIWTHPDDETKLQCTYCRWEGPRDATEGDDE